MTLTYKKGDLLDDDADILVNPVNCVGVMGAGLAKQFKERWPAYFTEYQQLCEENVIKPGVPTLHQRPDESNLLICSFPTKSHWKLPSNLIMVHKGLQALSDYIDGTDWEGSIAFPKLGCGLGGLNWSDVNKLIEIFESAHPELDIRVYA